jgi:uncharacterized protein (TIRG00374 family)
VVTRNAVPSGLSRSAGIPWRRLQPALGVLISAIALYVALRGIEWSDAGEALQEARYPLLLPALVALLSALLLRSIRWRLLFYPQPGLELRKFFGTLNVGYLVNNLLPFQVGDLVRAYLLGELQGLSKARTLSTVILERVVDVLVLFGLLLCLVPFVSVPAWAAVPTAVAAGLCLLVGGVLVGVAGNRLRALSVLEALLRFVPGRFHENFRGIAESVLDGLAVLSRPRILAMVVGWSLGSWMTTALALFFVMMAFNLGVSFSAAIFVLVMTSFGFFVPSSPGALGVYHAISIESLVRVFDIDRGLAASYSMVAYLLFYTVPLVIGGLFLWRERFSWRRLRVWTAQQAAAPDSISIGTSLPDETESSA